MPIWTQPCLKHELCKFQCKYLHLQSKNHNICTTTLDLFCILNSVHLIHLGSYRSDNRLLLRLLRVTVLPLCTLEALADVSQTRRFTVGTIGAGNGVGIL